MPLFAKIVNIGWNSLILKSFSSLLSPFKLIKDNNNNIDSDFRLPYMTLRNIKNTGELYLGNRTLLSCILNISKAILGHIQIRTILLLLSLNHLIYFQ